MIIHASVIYLRDVCRGCNSDCHGLCLFRFCGRDHGLARSYNSFNCVSGRGHNSNLT